MEIGSQKPRNVQTWVLLITVLVVGMLPVASPLGVLAQSEQTFDITLAELGYGEQTLRGPVAQTRYFFGLPAGWALQPDGTTFTLSVEYSVSGREGYIPALLEIILNGVTLQTESFETAGSRQIQVRLPAEDLYTIEDPYLNDLQINLVVSSDCEQAQLSALLIRPSSTLHFVYTEKPLPLDLARWPKPLYQKQAFEANRIGLVMPSSPASGTIRAALITAAGLFRQGGDDLSLDLTLTSQENLPSALDEHFILIGTPDRLPLLQRLDLPLPLAERQFQLQSQMPAAIVPGVPFSYTLRVTNTSAATQTFFVEDRLPSNATFLACDGGCVQRTAGTVRWSVGQVAAGQTISNVLRLRLDPAASVGEPVAHTATLFDGAGAIVNVDTLTGEVATNTTPQVIASPAQKSKYFFHDGKAGIVETDGVVQETVSPWSARRAVVIITGLNDAALFKAAYALSTKSRFPGMSGLYALVQDVRPFPSVQEEPVQDILLAELGYSDNTLGGAIFDTANYFFEVPGGWMPAEESSLNLHFAHSKGLDNISATLDVRLNGTPIGSVDLGTEEAADAWTKFPLPRTPFQPGRNRLEVRVSARRETVCVDPRDTHLWLTLYADSFLHLSYQAFSAPPRLEDFPYPFSDMKDLSDVLFVLPAHPSAETLLGVLKLAGYLGSASRGDGFRPRLLLAERPPQEEELPYDLIVVGRPTTNPFIAAANRHLPQPFRPGSDEIEQQIEDVVYRLPAGIDLGYVQLLPSPWNEKHPLLVVTGTTEQGVMQALQTFAEARLRRLLKGNLALVQGEEVRTIDTTGGAGLVFRQTQQATGQPAVQETVTPTPTSALATTTTPTFTAVTTSQPVTATTVAGSDGRSRGISARPRPAWLVPALVVTIVLLLVSIGGAMWQARR